MKANRSGERALQGLEASMSSNLATVRALEQKAAAMQGSLQSISDNEARALLGCLLVRTRYGASAP